MEEDLVGRVHAYIAQHTLLASGEIVVVAVSGGADSLCLLHLLHKLAPTVRCRLQVAHLDHGVRAGSDQDAAFVAAQAVDLHLPYILERRDVGMLARDRRVSLETAGRIARYDFLRRVASRAGATAIAMGHTRDDQAETILMRLARGSGLNGLTGMLPRRDDIVRPLLDIGRAETAAYCACLGLTPRVDASNNSPAFTRNRLRHDVLPRLEEIQPAAIANMARAAHLLAGDLALIERLANRALDDAIVTRTDTATTLSAHRWAAAERELHGHMARLLVVRLVGHAEGFGEHHYTMVMGAIGFHSFDGTLDLPHGLILERQGDVVTFGWGVGDRSPTEQEPMDTYTLFVPGTVETAMGTLRAELVTAPSTWSELPPYVAYLDPSAGAPLRVRPWRHGDRVHPLGLGGARKVQDIFVDRKTPRAIRRRIPIVDGPRGIAWVAGHCTGEPYRVAPGAPAVRLTWDANNTGVCQETCM